MTGNAPEEIVYAAAADTLLDRLPVRRSTQPMASYVVFEDSVTLPAEPAIVVDPAPHAPLLLHVGSVPSVR